MFLNHNDYSVKQAIVDIFTSILALVNYFTGILSFVPVVFFPNFIISMMTLPVQPVVIAVFLMIGGVLLDVLVHRSKMGYFLVVPVHAFAYWILTPNVLLVALFTGVILFGQLVLK